jgi:hypothetical protein
MNRNLLFKLLMDTNAPPGIIHPLFIENYSWVDIRLRELYYDTIMYTVFTDTMFIDDDEYQDTRLLQQKMFWKYTYDYTKDTVDEYYDDTQDFAIYDEQLFELEYYLDGYDSVG